MSDVLLSIVVVNWKVRDLLRECLQSTIGQTALSRERYEIVVVDNDSCDGSVEMMRAEFPRVHLIANEKNIGFGAANNQAMAHCRGEWILLLNPDTVVQPQAIDRMLEKMATYPRVASLGCRLVNADGSLQKWTGGAFPTFWNLVTHYFFLDRLLPRKWRSDPLYLDHDVQDDVSVGWVSGACMLLRRSAVGERIFDPAYFMYGEDMELCYRLRKAGHEVVYTPAATIMHYQGASMKQQQGDIMLSSLKGPRQFFMMTHGKGKLWLFDGVTLLGFLLRWLLYSMASVLPGREGLREQAASSRRYAAIIQQLMRA